MYIRHIVITTEINDDIGKVFNYAMKLAKKHDTFIKFEFNGVQFEVYQTTNKKLFIQNYMDRLFKTKSKRII